MHSSSVSENTVRIPGEYSGNYAACRSECMDETRILIKDVKALCERPKSVLRTK